MPFADLTTAEAAQAWAGQVVSEDLIAAASAQVQRWLGYAVASQGYTRALNGTGGPTLMLPDRPITAVSSLGVDGATVLPSAGPGQPGFVFDERTVSLIGGRFCRGIQNVAISYTAGLADIPPDIAQACLITIKAAMDRAAREADLVAQKAGDTEQRFAAAARVAISSFLPADALALLAPYRRVAPC